MNTVLIYYVAEETPQNVRDIIRAITEGLNIRSSNEVNLNEKNFEDLLSYASQSASEVIIHNTATYFPETLERILKILMKHRPSQIIVMKQDEYLSPKRFDDLFDQYEVKTVFTCVRAELIEKVYPKSVKNNVRFNHMYTTYITPGLLALKPKTSTPDHRLSYRGLPQPVVLGELGRQKTLMPQMIKKALGHLNNHTWIVDASAKSEDRVYGKSWIDLLKRSRVVLGSESGSNVFDLQGKITSDLEAFEYRYGKVAYENIDQYKLFQSTVLEKPENTIDYGTIGPRHIETALIGTPQVLIRGKYEGLFIDEANCIQVEPDLSDLFSTLVLFEDVKFTQQIGRAARESVLDTKNLRISNLITSLSDAVNEVRSSRDSDVALSKAYPKMATLLNDRSIDSVILTPTLAHLDPRHQWWKQSLENEGFTVQTWQFGKGENTKKPDAYLNRTNHHTLSIYLELKASQEIVRNWAIKEVGNKNLSLLFAILALTMQKEFTYEGHLAEIFIKQIATLICIPKENVPALAIACDLQTAFAACLVFDKNKTRVYYDAQESFPDQYLMPPIVFTQAQFNFWLEIDNFTMKNCYGIICMTEELSELAFERANVKSCIIPNFPPLSDANFRRDTSEYTTKFVFLGQAAPMRGLDNMISNWIVKEKVAELHLYIPDNEYRRHLEKLANRVTNDNLSKIIFHKPVAEDMIIETLSAYDVGVIPYNYSYPYNHCSPNKFGQYLAAGLAILSNDLDFIAKKVNKYELGKVFCWRDEESFMRCSLYLTNKLTRKMHQENAQRAFNTKLNWEFVSKDFFIEVKTYANNSNTIKPVPYLESIVDSSSSKKKLVGLVMNILVDNSYLRSTYLFARKLPVIGPFVHSLKNCMIRKSY